MVIVIFSAFWLFMKLDGLFLNSLSMYVKEQPGHSFKLLLMCFTERKKNHTGWNDMFEMNYEQSVLFYYYLCDDIVVIILK